MKQCTECLVEKSEDEFYFCDKEKRWRFKACKVCHRKKAVQSQIDRGVTHATHATRVKKRNIVAEFLSSGCTDCGIQDLRVLECDHVSGTKTSHISTMMKLSKVDDLRKELELCVVRCANCHRIQTIERQGESHWRYRLFHEMPLKPIG